MSEKGGTNTSLVTLGCSDVSSAKSWTAAAAAFCRSLLGGIRFSIIGFLKGSAFTDVRSSFDHLSTSLSLGRPLTPPGGLPSDKDQLAGPWTGVAVLAQRRRPEPSRGPSIAGGWVVGGIRPNSSAANPVFLGRDLYSKRILPFACTVPLRRILWGSGCRVLGDLRIPNRFGWL